jgi:hypothetical protein
MGAAYTPGLRVTARAVVRKARRLPLAGQVLVGLGDRVEARQVVARTDLPGKVFPVNVANQLGVLPDEVPAAMRRQPGEPIQKGDLLAETRSFFGLFHADVRSPIAGTVDSVSKVTGQVILREPPIPVEVAAYVAGTVVEELPHEGVVVETEGAYVQGIFGLAGEVHAPLAIVAASPDEALDEDHIPDHVRGMIVLGGALLTLRALRRCIQLGAAGVVCGGFAYHDIQALLGHDLGVAVTGHEKLATTLVITEGFGPISMARATYELLASLEGELASMNGATQIRAGVIRPEIIVPSARPAGAAEAPPPSGMEPGAPVRCIRAPYFGRLGTIAALPPELRAMPSETQVRVVEVELAGGERVTVPRANVELIERT